MCLIAISMLLFHNGGQRMTILSQRTPSGAFVMWHVGINKYSSDEMLEHH